MTASLFPGAGPSADIYAEPAGTIPVLSDEPSGEERLTIEQIQEMIDALPSEEELRAIAPEELQTVYIELQEAYDAYEALTDEEKARITGAEKLEALLELYNELISPPGEDLDAPSIPEGGQPMDAIAEVGNEAEFSVIADGYPEPSYQWQRDTGTGQWEDIEGATESVWTIPAVDLSMNGLKARCVLSNSQGTLISESAALTVVKPTPEYRAPEARNLFYTGTAQELIQRGSIADADSTAKFEYRLGDEGEYLETVPKAVEAGDYTVYWRISGGERYADVSGGALKATIARSGARFDGGVATFRGAERTSDFIYGDVATITASPKPTGMTPALRLLPPSADQMAIFDGTTQISEAVGEENGVYTMTIRTADLGTGVHALTARYAGSGNMADGEQGFSITVNPAALSNVSVKQDGSLTANGMPQTPSVKAEARAVNDQPVSFTYSAEKDGAYSSSLPSFTEKGEYTVYFKASAPNHEETTGSFTVTVNAAQASEEKPEESSKDAPGEVKPEESSKDEQASEEKPEESPKDESGEKKPEPKEPEVKQPEENKPAQVKPEPKQSETNKSLPKKPEQNKPASPATGDAGVAAWLTMLSTSLASGTGIALFNRKKKKSM